MFLTFDGEYTVFAGLEERLKFVQNYKFHASEIDYLRTTLPDYVENEFYDYLTTLDMNDVKIYAMPEGKFDILFCFLFVEFRHGGISSFTFASYRRTYFESTTT
jgi:nicotinic acid phosphoribosyltransferase